MSAIARGAAYTTRVMALDASHAGHWLLAVEGSTLGDPRFIEHIESEPAHRVETHDKLLTLRIGGAFATLALHGATRVMIRAQLEEPPAERQTKWSLSSDAERASLDVTPTSVGQCSGCGEPLFTEGDFARHFTISDRRYKNLGSCPIADAKKRTAESDAS